MSRIEFEFYLVCLLLNTEMGIEIGDKHTDKIFITNVVILVHLFMRGCLEFMDIT